MVRNDQILKHTLKVMRAGLADRRGVGCNRKSDVKNTKVLSLSHRRSPLPEEEARGREAQAERHRCTKHFSVHEARLDPERKGCKLTSGCRIKPIWSISVFPDWQGGNQQRR